MNSSKYVKLHETCRVCLRQEDKMVWMRENDYKIKDMCYLIKLISGSEIVFHKMLPSHICELCVPKLEIARDLKITLMRTNKILNECLKTAKIKPNDDVFETTHVYPFEKTVKIITPIELHKLSKVIPEVTIKKTDQKLKETGNKKSVFDDNNEGQLSNVISKKLSLSVNKNKDLLSKTVSEKNWGENNTENSLIMIDNDSFGVQEAVNSNWDKQQKAIETSFNNKNVKEMINAGKPFEIIKEFSPPKMKNKSLLSKTVVKDKNIEKDDVINKKLLSVNKNIFSKTIPEKNMSENNKEKPVIMIDNKPFVLKGVSLIPNEIIKNSFPEKLIDSFTGNMPNLIKIDKEKFNKDELKNSSTNLNDNRLSEMIFDPTVNVQTEIKNSLLINENKSIDKIKKDKGLCKICNILFDFQKDLDKHNKIEHPDKETVNCPLCCLTFVDPQTFQLHFSIFHQKFKCATCLLKFTNEDVLRKHNCPEKRAPIQENENPSMDEKQKNPIKRKFLCSYCGEIFVNSKKLNSHTRYHTGKKLHSCQFCGKEFPKMSKLWNHEKVHRNEKASINCEICNKSFETTKQLYLHKTNVHLAKVFTCQLCLKKFRNNLNLEHHIGNIHTKMVCSICKEECVGKIKFRRHLKTHSKQLFPCSKCSRTFQKVECLQKHLENHDFKPYKCPICDYKTAGGRYLTLHISSRHPEMGIRLGKHYRCLLCKKLFTSQIVLNIHKQIRHSYKT